MNMIIAQFFSWKNVIFRSYIFFLSFRVFQESCGPGSRKIWRKISLIVVNISVFEKFQTLFVEERFFYTLYSFLIFVRLRPGFQKKSYDVLFTKILFSIFGLKIFCQNYFSGNVEIREKRDIMLNFKRIK